MAHRNLVLNAIDIFSLLHLLGKYQSKSKPDLTGISSTIENESWVQNENIHSDQFWFYLHIDVLKNHPQDKSLYLLRFFHPE
ncbi:hypothetical protein M2G63_21025 [Vibrio vulnificus]|nr:hypothetical protein [Vibrio vulnificus]EKZ9057055.1 hypothetical protein [Vibrio vulnificus]MCU8395115.1 hypothetical protein [Vibrio vulnificus]MCU8540538.1 hypothetical protein [Vibrio vulnificus]MCU8543330.1 hypothetical protein [Vibrio vulnificus]